VLTHDPIALFEEAARHFVRLVAEESRGRMEVAVFTPGEYGGGQRVPPAEVMQKVAAGELEMSQTYATVLGKLSPRLWTLDLPFLFRSHEHAASVLDGPVGAELLEGLVPAGLRGLAFTYSGGYRIVSSVEKELRSVEDFQGLRVRTSGNPVVTSLFNGLGAVPHAAPLHEIPALTEQRLIDAAESTWPRYWDMGHFRAQPIVNETSHSLFLTALVINERFYCSLPAFCQEVLRHAALEMARAERRKSVADGEMARAAWRRQGGTVVSWSPDARDRFAAAAGHVYRRFTPEFGSGLIDRIRATAG
jgi:TRAP-type C4-dicarboxylate transport system substrate-binding protein